MEGISRSPQTAPHFTQWKQVPLTYTNRNKCLIKMKRYEAHSCLLCKAGHVFLQRNTTIFNFNWYKAKKGKSGFAGFMWVNRYRLLPLSNGSPTRWLNLRTGWQRAHTWEQPGVVSG